LAKIIGLIVSEKYSYLKRLSFFGFTYLLLVGVITQIFKHFVGRPRPNHALLDGSFEFSFFNAESAFHSFPSGHSSTIIAVAIIGSLALPGFRYFFYFCGFIIALSRVVVGAHFFTDVFGGALIALIVYRVFDFFVSTKYPKLYWGGLEYNKTSLLTKTLIVFFVLAVFATAGPDLDMYISNFFYYGDSQFQIQSYNLVSIFFRKILLPLILIYIFIIPLFLRFLPLQKIYFNYRFSISEIIFVWTAGAFTILLIINVLLKNMWGRVRPNDVVPFGGDETFAPWYKIGDSCLTNCSFVSGDSSIGFFLIVFYLITKKNIYLYLSLIFGSFLGLIRVVAGGHFFSDVVFSQIVVTASVLVFYILYRKLYDK
jgi:lipid A 4'-phosphatase